MKKYTNQSSTSQPFIQNNSLWQEIPEELAKRKALYLQNPDSGSSWEAAKERIRSQQHGA